MIKHKNIYSKFTKIVCLIVCILISKFSNSQDNWNKTIGLFNTQQYQLALDEIKLISTDTKHLDSLLYIKAYSQLKLNQVIEAKKTTEQLQKAYPNFYNAFYLKGLIFAKQENYVKAITQFNKALNYIPKHEKALYNRALSKGMLDDYDGAIKDLDSCLIINANYTVAYYGKAYWLEMKGDYTKAITQYEKVISLDKKYNEAYYALAYCYSQTGNNTKACEILNTAKNEGIEAANDLIQNYCK